MKKFLSKPGVVVALCLMPVLLLPLKSIGQYGPNDYVLSTQSQVDAFDPGLLQGRNLVVSGANITNINRLSNLTRVNGLVVENNPLLTSLAPLNNVDSVYGDLRIAGNPLVGIIDGFSSLKSVVNLTISDNVGLTSLSGFNSLLAVYTLAISHNPNLLTISGFNGLPTGQIISIHANDKLTAISGFHLLTSVHYVNRYSFGQLSITNNPELTNLDGFLAITSLDFFTLSGNSKLKNVDGFANWTTLYGYTINISNNASLENLDGLSNLTNSRINGILSPGAMAYLDHNPLLTKPCGIYKILDQLNYIVEADKILIEGSGFHLYQLIECGTTRINVPPSPVIALDFDEGAGTAPFNSGTLGAYFTRSSGTPLSSPNAPVNVGGANAFDFGTTAGNYYVESTAPIDGLKNLSGFTLTGWLNCKLNTAGSGGNRIISWINNGGDGVDLVYQANGSLRLGVDGWPDNSPAFSSAGKVPTSASGAASNWIFFAVTYQSNGQVQFYFGNTGMDATLDVTKTYPGRGATGAAIGKLAVGAFNDATRNAGTFNRMFRGLIDEVQIYDEVLDYEKILTIQHAVGQVTPPKPKPVLISKTSTTVTLQWPAATTPTSITYGIIKNGEVTYDVTYSGEATRTAVITGLSPATTYNFAVRASAFFNYYIDSNPISVTTDPTVSLHIEAESYNAANGVVKRATTVESTDAGDWIRFDNVNLGSGYSTISARYAKGNNVNGTAIVRLGNPTTGTVIGTLTPSYTGGWGTFALTSAPLTGGTGIQTVYVYWPSGEGNGNYDWFELRGGTNSGDDTAPPTVPANLVLVSKTATSVSLSWTAATDNVGVTGYEVEGTRINDVAVHGTSATNSITLNNLVPNIQYFFSVRAKDAANNYSPFIGFLGVTTDPIGTLRLEAESYNAASGIVKQPFTVESTDAGDWIRFDNVNLASGYLSITARYAKGNNVNGGAVFRLDNPTSGSVLGTLTTSYTGGWGTFTTGSTRILGASGVHSIYVIWPTGMGNGNFDWFEFGGQITQPAAGRMDMSVASTPAGEDEEETTNELYENYPNPFTAETVIGVSLKRSVKVARIVVNDLNGRSLKNIEVLERGKTTVTVNGADMKSGIYIYSLTVDGKVIAFKRMAIFE